MTIHLKPLKSSSCANCKLFAVASIKLCQNNEGKFVIYILYLAHVLYWVCFPLSLRFEFAFQSQPKYTVHTGKPKQKHAFGEYNPFKACSHWMWQWQWKPKYLLYQECVTLDCMEVFTWRPAAMAIATHRVQHNPFFPLPLPQSVWKSLYTWVVLVQ